MEEAELLKERLQAITEKRKIQEDIARKRTEIDEEKLKLQYLKKKALREQWLQDGVTGSTAQEQEDQRLQAQDSQRQTRLLQTNIHRLEQEIQALERQEMMISTNEGFILKRLKAIEKTPQDIIKEAKYNAKQEAAQCIYSAIPDVPKSYKATTPKKQQSLDLETKEPKKALFAMEINVQKDLRTGESQVLSTAKITDREFQQRGIKVYDDGKRSVYALGPEGRVLPNGVEELTPTEVEELLRKATDRKPKMATERRTRAFSEQGWVGPGTYGLHQPYQRTPIAGTPPELCYRQFQGEKRSYQSNIPHPYGGGQVERPFPHSAHSQYYFSNGGEAPLGDTPPNGEQALYPEERCPVPFSDPRQRIRKSSSGRSSSFKSSVLNAMPANPDPTEPVTMIFMGYQRADDDVEDGQQGYEGAVRAELVVIGDEDEDATGARRTHHPGEFRGHPPYPCGDSRAGQYLTKPNTNANNASLHAASTPAEFREYRPCRYSDWEMDGDSSDPSPAVVKKVKNKKKYCCTLM